MSALLHCIITSIEDDRVKENLKVWRDNNIEATKRMKTQLNEFEDILDDMPNINPYFSLLINDDEQDYYDDDYYGKNKLRDDIKAIIKNERNEYKGQEIIVKHYTYSVCGEETIRVVFRMLIE